jgi:MFS family permease
LPPTHSSSLVSTEDDALPSLDTLTPHLEDYPEGFRSLLKNRSFLALWLGQILSQLADRVVFVAFVATLVHYFGTNDRLTSFLYIAFTIPAILLTAIAGVFVDRWPRRAVLVWTNVLRALLVFGLPWAAQQPTLWPIYGLAFFLSAATQFFVPAEAATIPMIVRKSQLMAANSLFTTTMMGSVIFGFALGDPLINIFSLGQVQWPLGVLFLLAALFLMGVRTPPMCLLADAPEGASGSPAAAASEEAPLAACVSLRAGFHRFFGEMHSGIDYIRQNPVLLRAMLKLATLFSVVVALCVLFVSFAKEFLYSNPEVAARKFAYIITFSGIGMVIGALLVGRFGRTAPRAWLVYGGFFVIGACLTLLSLTGSLDARALLLNLPPLAIPWLYLDPVHLSVRMAYTYLMALCMGLGAASVAIPLQALVHELIPEDKRGKILGVQFTLLSTASTLPVLLVGLMVEHFGSQPLFLMFGIFLLVLGVRGLYQRLTFRDVIAPNW